MKKSLTKALFVLFLIGVFLFAFVVIILLNPKLFYNRKTKIDNFNVYHNSNLNSNLKSLLQETSEIIKSSEFYNKNLQLDICLNDNSLYPELIKKIRGQAFGYGFYNKVVLLGTPNYEGNYVEFNGYKWNLKQLLAHEIVHCQQFDNLGFYKSNPIANLPNWKWEGYAEYISRNSNDQNDLKQNIVRLQSTSKNSWGVKFSNQTITPRFYNDYWNLVKYCMDIKKMTYRDILIDTTSETKVKEEMTKWFLMQPSK